jgi:phenylalanyl-tRNA synthetase beta subunit
MKDITIKEDIVEEVVRCIGFEAIEAQAIPGTNAIRKRQGRKQMQYMILDYLSAQGGIEVYNYSFTNDQKESLAGIT